MQPAQTNIQLYNQLCRSGWTESDLSHLHDAYQWAMPIFAGHFRPNDKPFLAHLVGVASILATSGVESTVVAAGLLHSAYSHGEFGDGSRGITDRKRLQARRAVGAACEKLIARYATMSWNLQSLVALSAQANRLTAVDKAATIIKLADVLEDHLDLGMQYSPNKCTGERAADDDAWRRAVVDLAEALGQPALADELKRVLHSDCQQKIPTFLCASRSSSYVVAPVSHSMRTSVRLARALARWRRKITSANKHLGRRAA
jgi:(p)ppGpp synthase/HD superfamily hydrolase